MIEVKKCDDGFIVFTEDGHEIYDLLINDAQPLSFWLYHLEDKNWFTGDVRAKLIDASGLKVISNQ